MTHFNLPGHLVKSFQFHGHTYDITWVDIMTLDDPVPRRQYRLYRNGITDYVLFVVTLQTLNEMTVEYGVKGAEKRLAEQALQKASDAIVQFPMPGILKKELEGILYGDASASKSLPKFQPVKKIEQVHFPEDVAFMGVDFAEAEDKMVAAMFKNVHNFQVQQQAAGVVWDSAAGMGPPHGAGLVQSLPPSEHYGMSIAGKLMSKFQLPHMTKQQKFAALYGGTLKPEVSPKVIETLHRFGAVLAS